MLSLCLALLSNLFSIVYENDSITSFRYKFMCLSNKTSVPLYSRILDMKGTFRRRLIKILTVFPIRSLRTEMGPDVAPTRSARLKTSDPTLFETLVDSGLQSPVLLKIFSKFLSNGTANGSLEKDDRKGLALLVSLLCDALCLFWAFRVLLEKYSSRLLQAFMPCIGIVAIASPRRHLKASSGLRITTSKLNTCVSLWRQSSSSLAIIDMTENNFCS